MSQLPTNATVLPSSDIIISQNDSEIRNSYPEVAGSGGSIFIVGSQPVSINSLNISNNTLLPEIRKDLKEKLLSMFSEYNIVSSNLNLDYTFFSFDEISRNESWKNKIYKIRRIKRDNNNFIRSIIFSFLENIILNNDKSILKEFIIKSNEIQDIKNKEKLIHILYIIYELLKDNTMDAYIIFLKVFLFFKEFENDLNLLVRKLIYKYGVVNQNKSLKDEEANKLSKSLPDKNNNNNKEITQSYDGFRNDLIYLDYEVPYNEMYSKIIPYIFKCDLNIIEYNPDDKKSNSEQLKEIKYKYNESNNSGLNLIYFKKEKYFNIYYSKDYFQKNDNYFKLTNNNTCKKNNLINDSEKTKDNKKDKSILDEINEYLYIQYIAFREENATNTDDLTRNRKRKIIDYISKQPCQFSFIKDKNKTLGEVIIQAGFNISDLIEKIKQRICLVCTKDITNKNNNEIFSLPCKCNICSLECLKLYFKSILEKNELRLNKNGDEIVDPMSECYCGYCYKLKGFNEFKNLAKKINNKDFLNIINEAIANNQKWKCLLCRKNFNKTNKFLCLKINDENVHLLCEKCCKEKKININEEKKKEVSIELFCKFCEKKHDIKSLEFVEESNCIIF